MILTRRRFPESFKRQAVDQVLAGTPPRHAAETLDLTESLLGKCKRQFEQQGDDTFPGKGKQHGESAQLRRLHQQLAQVTLQRDILKMRSPSSHNPRREVPRQRGADRSLSRSADVRLRVRSRRRWRLVSSSRHALPIAANHLDHLRVSDRANRHWVSDMTYVRTAQGLLYLAVVLVLYSCAVIGWAMHHRMQQTLAHATREMAMARRKPQNEVLLPPDRGSQCCAYDYQALLRRHRIVPSHSHPGDSIRPCRNARPCRFRRVHCRSSGLASTPCRAHSAKRLP